MKGWSVWNDNGAILVRADTRSRAKTMHPDYSRYDRESFLSMHATREPWLDGDGPQREIFAEYEPCDCREPDGCGECFDGERLSKAKTLARLDIAR